MAKTYEAIASQTLGSNTASVTFSSIPGTYTDLVIVAYATKTDGAANACNVRFNGDTASNYSSTAVWGTGSTPDTTRFSGQAQFRSAMTGISTTNREVWISHIMSYANTNVYKTVLMSNAGDLAVERSVHLWRSTSAVTSITLFLSSSKIYSSGSTFSLYGIKAA